MTKQSDNNLCSEIVTVLYEDRRGRTRSTTANLEQISSGHAVLLSDDCPQPGAPIAFDAQGHDFYGVVESIELDDTLGCFTKIKLEAASRWHGRVFVPEHFLALCSLVQSEDLDAPVVSSPKAFTVDERSGS